jgi:hypothetical protein
VLRPCHHKLPRKSLAFSRCYVPRNQQAQSTSPFLWPDGARVRAEDKGHPTLTLPPAEKAGGGVICRAAVTASRPKGSLRARLLLTGRCGVRVKISLAAAAPRAVLQDAARAVRTAPRAADRLDPKRVGIWAHLPADICLDLAHAFRRANRTPPMQSSARVRDRIWEFSATR